MPLPQLLMPLVTRDSVPSNLWPAIVAAGTALLVMVANQTFNLLAERQKRQKEVELARLTAETKFQDSRRDALRVAVAAFAASAVHEVELASSLMKDPDQPQIRADLTNAHGALRAQYEGLLLLGESTAVHDAAREVLRVAWNERQEGLGLERKRPRPVGLAPSKYLRQSLRSLHREARRELGLQPELHPEPTD